MNSLTAGSLDVQVGAAPELRAVLRQLPHPKHDDDVHGVGPNLAFILHTLTRGTSARVRLVCPSCAPVLHLSLTGVVRAR